MTLRVNLAAETGVSAFSGTVFVETSSNIFIVSWPPGLRRACSSALSVPILVEMATFFERSFWGRSLTQFGALQWPLRSRFISLYPLPFMCPHSEDDRIALYKNRSRCSSSNTKLLFNKGIPRGMTATHPDQANADPLEFIQP